MRSRRQIAGVMRSVAKYVAMEEEYDKNIKPEQLKDMLGPARFTKDIYKEKQPAGGHWPCMDKSWRGNIVH
ncbi:MAG: hypothetical protein R2788_07200 [Saprospiraceae bacterium]